MKSLNPEFAGLDNPIPTTLYLASQMPFGKHQGLTVEEVCDQYPDYIDWFSSNIDRYCFDTSVYTYMQGSEALPPMVSEDYDYNWASLLGEAPPRRHVQGKRSALQTNASSQSWYPDDEIPF